MGNPEVFPSLSELHEREAKLASTIEFEVNPWEGRALAESFHLPARLKGIRLLDLGAGGTNLVPYAINRGADAYAVDCLYGDVDRMKSKFEEFKANMRSSPPITPEFAAQLDMIEDARWRYFLDAYHAQPQRFVQGWLTQLPLGDGFSDYTISRGAISFARKDKDLFRTEMSEAFRVTKKGGKVIIDHPSSDPTLLELLKEQVGDSRINGVEVEMPKGTPGIRVYMVKA